MHYVTREKNTANWKYVLFPTIVQYTPFQDFAFWDILNIWGKCQLFFNHVLIFLHLFTLESEIKVEGMEETFWQCFLWTAGPDDTTEAFKAELGYQPSDTTCLLWVEQRNVSVFVAYRYLRKNDNTEFTPIGKKKMQSTNHYLL